VKAVLEAAPILIAYLGGGSGLPVAEQCAWALGELLACRRRQQRRSAAAAVRMCSGSPQRLAWHAWPRRLTALRARQRQLFPTSLCAAPLPSPSAGNIAAEDFEFRQTLISNGVVRPLAQLLVQARKALDSGTGKQSLHAIGGRQVVGTAAQQGPAPLMCLPPSVHPRLVCRLLSLPAADTDDPALAAGTTAAWALSNVLKGAGREVGEVVAVESAPEAIVRLVAAAPEHLATEAAWVLAYITGGRCGGRFGG
jgi:hypothetical protein